MTTRTELRIAVPPGVGDTLWVLTKLKDFHRHHGGQRVVLCVQASKLTRALEWSQMVSFVHETREVRFKPDPKALVLGYSCGTHHEFDHCLWPNAVVDRGWRLERWLPEYEIDLGFPIACDPPLKGRSGLALAYPSSSQINAAWLPRLGADFWRDLFVGLAKELPLGLIGAGWDQPFKHQLVWPPGVQDLIGRTSLREVAGIIRDARVVVGVISGMTILANHFGTPCVAICPDKFPKDFPFAWTRPDVPYAVLRAGKIESAAQVVDHVLALAR